MGKGVKCKSSLVGQAIVSPSSPPPPRQASIFPSRPRRDGRRRQARPCRTAKGVFMRRIFPFLLATNVFIGVYVFAKTYKRDQEKKNAEAAAAAAAALSSPASATAKAEDPVPAPAPATKIVRPPLSEDEQRQVYKWMLEEKRKIKPRDAAEKKKINEEKALLKEFIRAQSLPRL